MGEQNYIDFVASSLDCHPCINGLICVGLVYPGFYIKATPVITSKNIITIMFMIPSNKQVRKQLVR